MALSRSFHAFAVAKALVLLFATQEAQALRRNAHVSEVDAEPVSDATAEVPNPEATVEVTNPPATFEDIGAGCCDLFGAEWDWENADFTTCKQLCEKHSRCAYIMHGKDMYNQMTMCSGVSEDSSCPPLTHEDSWCSNMRTYKKKEATFVPNPKAADYAGAYFARSGRDKMHLTIDCDGSAGLEVRTNRPWGPGVVKERKIQLQFDNVEAECSADAEATMWFVSDRVKHCLHMDENNGLSGTVIFPWSGSKAEPLHWELLRAETCQPATIPAIGDLAGKYVNQIENPFALTIHCDGKVGLEMEPGFVNKMQLQFENVEAECSDDAKATMWFSFMQEMKICLHRNKNNDLQGIGTDSSGRPPMPLRLELVRADECQPASA